MWFFLDTVFMKFIPWWTLQHFWEKNYLNYVIFYTGSPLQWWCPDNYQLIVVIQTITGISVSWYPLWISYDCCLTNMYYLVVFTFTVLTGIYFYIWTKVFSVVAGTGIYAWKSTFETLAFPWLWTVFVCTIHMGDIPNFDWCWVFQEHLCF